MKAETLFLQKLSDGGVVSSFLLDLGQLILVKVFALLIQVDFSFLPHTISGAPAPRFCIVVLQVSSSTLRDDGIS